MNDPETANRNEKRRNFCGQQAEKKTNPTNLEKLHETVMKIFRWKLSQEFAKPPRYRMDLFQTDIVDDTDLRG